MGFNSGFEGLIFDFISVITFDEGYKLWGSSSYSFLSLVLLPPYKA